MATVTAVLEHEGKQYIVTQDSWDVAKYDDEAHMERAIEWIWTEGNYGCDCNRFLFISYEHDDYPGTEDEDGWFPCGRTVKLVSLGLDGKDLLAPTPRERLAAIGLFAV